MRFEDEEKKFKKNLFIVKLVNKKKEKKMCKIQNRIPARGSQVCMNVWIREAGYG